MFGMAARDHRIRTDLGGTVHEAAYDPSRSRTIVRLVHLSDLHVIDVGLAGARRVGRAVG